MAGIIAKANLASPVSLFFSNLLLPGRDLMPGTYCVGEHDLEALILFYPAKY